jgi:hypothetical protein
MRSRAEQRLVELGLNLPRPPLPIANYAGARQVTGPRLVVHPR